MIAMIVIKICIFGNFVETNQFLKRFNRQCISLIIAYLQNSTRIQYLLMFPIIKHSP